MRSSALLGEIQDAWSNEDVAKLHAPGDPRDGVVFHRRLAENQARNVVNKVSESEIAAGRPVEAWREGDVDYASVAMRYSLVDKTLDRHVGRLVEGSDNPEEVTEVWTFLRPTAPAGELSAIQQA